MPFLAAVPLVAAASAAATAVGTGVSVYGAVKQGQAQQQAANYQAQVAKNNSLIATNNAALATQQGVAKVQQDQQSTAIKLGLQRAAMGAGGGTLDSGSNLDTQEATATAGALSGQRDQYNALLQSYGYRAQATNDTAQAGLDTMQGNNAATAGYISGASSLLSGASQFASKWSLPAQYGGYGLGGSSLPGQATGGF